jgi:hypothetical protein
VVSECQLSNFDKIQVYSVQAFPSLWFIYLIKPFNPGSKGDKYWCQHQQDHGSHQGNRFQAGEAQEKEVQGGDEHYAPQHMPFIFAELDAADQIRYSRPVSLENWTLGTLFSFLQSAWMKFCSPRCFLANLGLEISAGQK